LYKTRGFNACIGDFGNNNTIGTFTPELVVSYECPAYSLTVNKNGSVYMVYGYSGSDITLKTDIKPIENPQTHPTQNLWQISLARSSLQFQPKLALTYST
jgi:hypothetical protein